eukprot:scaffold39190_cov45-Phaeocystis_antarctica.AAC.2
MRSHRSSATPAACSASAASSAAAAAASCAVATCSAAAAEAPACACRHTTSSCNVLEAASGATGSGASIDGSDDAESVPYMIHLRHHGRKGVAAVAGREGGGGEGEGGGGEGDGGGGEGDGGGGD